MDKKMNDLEHIEELLNKAENEIYNKNFKQSENICNHALEHCNKDIQTPLILYRLGFIFFQSGNVDKAEKLWKDAIEDSVLKEDTYYQAFILHNVATIKANLGNITEATYLWEESLNIKQKINDKKGIASTLNNLAWVSKLEDNYIEETNLLIKASKLFTELYMWNELSDNLIRLSESDNKNKLNYLIQAFYISIKVFIEPRDFLYILTNIIQEIGIKHKYSKHFVGLGIIINQDLENNEILEVTQQLLIAIALSQNIKEENIKEWVIENKLNDIKFLIENLQKAFEDLNENNEWLFNPEDL
jgi:tetratricopeptide (TPR) repeat protein